MKRGLIIAAVTLLFGLLVSTLFFYRRSGEQESLQPRIAQASAPDTSGFARATGVKDLTFPLDHGPHLDYQTEWWYYTGNLQAENGRRFGFQLTFFRRALQPPAQMPRRDSDWAASQVYMAHFAVSDIADGKFHAFERLSRGAAGLAGAGAEPFRVWLEDWYVEQTPGRTDECHERSEPLCAYRLYAAQSGIILELDLLDQKGPILQGDQGYSQKGAQPGQASYYYSLTRLQSSGKVTVEGQTYAVSGTSWMDHEWSTSVLSQEQVGWDWFSLQFDDGSELMVFQIRRADGRVDPFSSGMLIAADGRTTRLGWEDFSIEVTDRWPSPHSGAVYPARWNLRVPLQRIELAIEPHMADQELNVSYAYWEGAVRVTGIKDGSVVKGNGYVELTGYSGSMGGEF